MTKRMLTCLALLSAALLSGCSHSAAASKGPAAADGSHARDVIRAIALCRTTEADLRRDLGAPTRDGIVHGRRVMSWIISEGDVVKYVAVLLNERGTVVDLYWDVPTEIPWVPADQCGGAAR